MSRRQHMSSGLEVDVFNLHAEHITITDIAHSLAMQCRFGGNTRFHYSVAQHCVYIARRMWDITKNPTETLTALLHDASEAYLLDLPRPIKELPVCEFYMAQERIIQRTIYEKYKCPTAPMDALLKAMDNRMLVMECQQLFNPGWVPTGFVDTHQMTEWNVGIQKWTPEDAKREFLTMFDHFRGAR